MRYIKPDYYEDFRCVAGACPDTCCAGWQIMIDEDSLEYYGKVQGEFGKRLRNSIDWQEGAFYQCNMRCAFLNEADLCDIYTALGEEALCQTCKNYPRHVEEYEGLRELSLSLSCPIAAKMILEQKNFPVFVEHEDEKEEELAEEFEDFDLLLFTQLEDARGFVMRHLEEAEGSLEEKLCLYLQFAREMQDCIDREEYFALDEVVRRYEEEDFEQPDMALIKKERYSHRRVLYGHIYELERLREEWSEVLVAVEKQLYAGGEVVYQKQVERWEVFCQQDTDAKALWEQTGLQLFVFFLYTYFCGAVYDDMIYSKMALVVESVRFIRELYLARWLEYGILTMEDCVELAYRYAREIEHSDQNLNDLEEVFGQSV